MWATMQEKAFSEYGQWRGAEASGQRGDAMLFAVRASVHPGNGEKSCVPLDFPRLAHGRTVMIARR